MGSEQEFSAFQQEQSLFPPEVPPPGLGTTQTRKSGAFSALGRFLGRNFFLLLLPAIAFGGAATYFVLRTPSLFSGEFQLLVEPITSPESVTGETGQQQAFDYETLTRLLASPNVLKPALPNIQSQGVEIDMDTLQRQLVVQRIGRQASNPADQTKLISVSLEDPQPEKIETVLSELAKRFLQYGDEERRKSLGGGVEFIEKQLPEVRQRVTALEAQIQQIEQQYRISDLDGVAAALATRSRELEAQRQQIQPALESQQQLKANLEKQLKLSPTQILAASQLSENPTIQGIEEEVRLARTELANLRGTLAETNPQIADAKDKLQNLEATLLQERQKVVGPSLLSGQGAVAQPQSQLQKNLGQQLIATLNEIQVLKIQNQALNEAALKIDEELRRFPTIKRQHSDLTTKLDIDRELLNKLLLQREDFRIQTAQKEIPWQVVKQPTLLRDSQGNLISTAEKDWYKIALATVGGLLLGLGASLLKEKRQDMFYGLDDLKSAVPLKLLGMVPLDKELKSVSGKSGLMPSESDEETYYRYGYTQRMVRVAENIYSNIRYILHEQPNQSLVIGSVMPGDGKTTLAVNLAKAVAGTGQRVLLVDANLTSPQLHSRFGLPNFQGLSDILAKNVDPNELIQRSPMHGSLFLLPAGQMSRKASKLLASNQMAYLMEQLQNMFDLVIYDTYNLQSSSSANFLAVNAQGLIWVIGVQKTRRSAVIKILERLQSSRIPITGMVANYVRDSIAQVDQSEDLESFSTALPAEEEDDEFEIFRVDP